MPLPHLVRGLRLFQRPFRANRRRVRHAQRTRRLRVEPLETRRLLDGALMVSTLADEADGDHGPGDLSLREALALAAERAGDDVIRFGDGLRGGTITLDPALGQLQIDSNLDIQGPGADQLTIDAAGNSRVFYATATVTISGLTITGGQTNDGEGGGGIFNAGTLAISGSTISGNSSNGGWGGGGILNGRTMTITSTVISNNSSHAHGGGISNSATLTVTNSTVSSNSAGSMGGGINSLGPLDITDSTIFGNSTVNGGGIQSSGPLAITNSTISGNSAPIGGGILFSGSATATAVTIANSRISDNSGPFGGGLYIAGVAVTITDSAIFGNEGEAVRIDNEGDFNSESSLTMVNSTISGNEMGVLVAGQSATHPDRIVTTTNCTIFDNGEWGILVENQPEVPAFLLQNTIIAGHTLDLVDVTLDPASSHNLIGGDPRLEPLADNGGPTLTHALLPDSPAIDAGDNAYAPATDQRGFARIVDGNGDGAATVDIGALELGSAVTTAVVGRHVFYNDSFFDGDDPTANAGDDAAIAPDKQALLPGQTATLANYTNYDKGINGIIVDLAAPAGTPGLEDFLFTVGNDRKPDGWDDAPQPTSVTVRPGDGIDGSDRVTITWADNAIGKQWLQVTVKANENTGLAQPDVFYFGNAVGESGNSTTEAKVNAFDILAAREHLGDFFDPVPIDFLVDYNRDALVNATDMLIAWDNPTHFLNALKLITVPGDVVLGGSKFEDFNGNGVRDDGEPGLPGWAIDLQRVGGEHVGTIVSPSAVWDAFAGVATVGGDVLVGAYYETQKAYLFDGTTGELLQLYDAPAGGRFGLGVAGFGQNVLVGAYEEASGGSIGGAVHVYDRAGNRLLDQPIRNLASSSGADRFGMVIRSLGDYIIIGASGTHDATGAVYVYDFATLDPASPAHAPTFTLDGEAAGDGFGGALAVSGTKVIVGADANDENGSDSGAIYVYDLADIDGVTEQPRLIFHDHGTHAGENFGTAAAATEDTLVVGAYHNSSLASQAGAAYLYKFADDTWDSPVETSRIDNPSPHDNDIFGISIAMDGMDLVIGAQHDSENGQPYGGAAYLFDSETGDLVRRLSDPEPNNRAMFGASVALTSDRIYVGSPDDLHGPGHVYAFTRTQPVGIPVVTGPEGEYEFAGLHEGVYRLSEVPQDGYTQTYPTSDTTVPDGYVAGNAYILTVGTENITGLDFGNWANPSKRPGWPGRFSGEDLATRLGVFE